MLREIGPTGRGFDPVRETQRAQADLNRLFGRLGSYPRPEFPLLNLWTSHDGAIVAAEVPGVNPEDLDITIRRDTVTLRGTRNPEPTNDGGAIAKYWSKTQWDRRRLSKARTTAARERLGVIWPTARCTPSSARNLRACESENAP